MFKFVTFAAFAVCAVAAMPANAADLHVANSTASVVRIALANKTPQQLDKEIRAAADLVCADANASATCVDDALADAKRQIKEATKVRQPAPKIEVARNDPTSVTILLAGKSLAQVNQEIDAAAQAVCKGVTTSEYHECVVGAAQDAKHRLAEAPRDRKLAMN